MSGQRSDWVGPVLGASGMAVGFLAVRWWSAHLRGDSVGTMIGVSVGWAAACAGTAWVVVLSRRLERRLSAEGLGAKDARARAQSWARRRGIVAWTIGAGVGVVAMCLGLLGGPPALGRALRGFGLLVPMALLFGAGTAWKELVCGTPVGEGARCSGCGYPASGGAGSICAECGRRLMFSFSVREGVIVRPVWARVAAVALPLSLALVLYLAIANLATRVVVVLPTDGLIALVETGQRSWAGAAAMELSRRSLTPEQVEAFSEAVSRSVLPPGLAPGVAPVTAP